MANILLQHWDKELDELGKLSSANMKSYAERMNADYCLLRGYPFRPNLASPCQKLAMLDESFDAYDIVVMVDMDMFAITDENVFELEGTGLYSTFTQGIFEKCREKHPRLTDKNYAYWGGAIYRLTREMRQRLRPHVRDSDMHQFSGNFNDEGIMHRLACLAKVKQDRIPDKWCQCSYLPNPEKAAMLHIRTKVTPTGPKRTKLENYQALQARIGPRL